MSDILTRDGYVILWLGSSGWEEVDGTLEDAIRRVKDGERYADYGDRGAVIVKVRRLYQVVSGPVEKVYP